jgi:hypothetical protein
LKRWPSSIERAPASPCGADTLLDASGVQGILTRLFAPRLMQPLYADELARLERYARAQTALVA